MEDIFSGDWWNIWKDNDMIFVSLGNVTVSFPSEMWDEIKEEFMSMI